MPVRLFRDTIPKNSPNILSDETSKTLQSNENKVQTDRAKVTNTANTQRNTAPANASSFNSIIKSASQKYQVDDSLVRAVVKTESGFNPQSLSSAGAMGLMQLMPNTAAGLGVTNAYDPEQNIDGGVRYLKQMMDLYHGDEKMALAAYNCGMGTLKRLGISNLDDPSQMSKLPNETKNYVKKISEMVDLDN
ncbi:MAG: lytic transglycosylase domain-containing protein [Hyphomonadaceae bacterium]|nr:lytic transglycosylase domain-containing protein [Clostridia bacterium]